MTYDGECLTLLCFGTIIKCFSESFKKGPALANCDKCISDFSDAGGCECIKKEDCNQLSLVPDGCLPCGEQAIEHCGITKDD